MLECAFLSLCEGTISVYIESNTPSTSVFTPPPIPPPNGSFGPINFPPTEYLRTIISLTKKQEGGMGTYEKKRTFMVNATPA